MIIRPGYARVSFELADDAIIADIGSGHNPLPEATYCIDRGTPVMVIPKCKLILADVSDGIPLPDKSCDFVVASHIAEHVDDPIAFCRELSRIGKEGYIETPSPWQEWLNNQQCHKWLVSNDNGTLVFTRKTKFRKKPPNKIVYLIADLIEYNVFKQTTYHWKGEIKSRIV
jgi:ubiquinone/menaquinone biosynthesis C-methylase UbiE